MKYVAEELREIMASRLPFDPEMRPCRQTEMRAAVDHWKAKGLDYSKILIDRTLAPESEPTARWIKTISSTVRSISPRFKK